jgi:hypothetical protein
MRKQLCCDTPTRRINLGWISFQPDDYSISFGLNDRTFIASKFKAQHFVWNAYNRERIRYQVISDTDALEPVRNPHFTYHPDAWFHLKENNPDADGALFEAIADLPLTLQQDIEMPWIRAYSGNVAQLSNTGSRKNVSVDELVLNVPTEDASVFMQLDFVRPNLGPGLDDQSRWYFTWGKIGLRVSVAFTHPRSPTLTWFHSH